MEDQTQWVKKWTDLVRKIWDDPSLKEALLSDPRKFLTQSGLEIPSSQTVEIHENGPERLHLVLPEKLKRELSDEILSHIVAGI